MSTFYQVLGLTPAANDVEIRSAYRRLARLMHPDVGGTAPLFCQVEQAYATLSDPELRAEYDASLGPSEPAPPRTSHDPGPTRDPNEDWDWDRGGSSSGWAPGGGWGMGSTWGPGSTGPVSGGTGHDPTRVRASNALSGLALRQPWAVLVAAGVLASAAFPVIGVWMLLAGLVAGVGARRTHRRQLVSGRPVSGLRLLGLEILCGCQSLGKLLLGLLGIMLLAGLVERSPSRRRRW
ncbi:MAG: J domain-containing protein [Acidimicrobiales bacterium]